MPANFQPSPPTDPDQIAAIDEINRGRLQGWWDLAGEEPHYPIGTADVVRLMQRVDYLVDNDTLVAWVNEKVIPPVPRQNGRLAWHATNIVAATSAAEARRKWKAFSTVHGHKLTMIEKINQIAAHRGEAAFADLAEFDIEGLLGVLVQVSCDQGAVQIMAEALRTKLQGMGVL
jgi:hypothetical protein